jgi:hypothetical protein
VEFKGKGKLAALTRIGGPPAMAREGFGRNNPASSVWWNWRKGQGRRASPEWMSEPRSDPVGTPLQAEFFPKEKA